MSHDLGRSLAAAYRAIAILSFAYLSLQLILARLYSKANMQCGAKENVKPTGGQAEALQVAELMKDIRFFNTLMYIYIHIYVCMYARGSTYVYVYTHGGGVACIWYWHTHIYLSTALHACMQIKHCFTGVPIMFLECSASAFGAAYIPI